MEMKSAAKVGIFAIVGFVLFFFGWKFLAHTTSKAITLYADFSNIKGLAKQTPLQMNGVTVGEVKDVGFAKGTLKPRVTLAIDDKFRDRIPVDSKIRITSGILITSAKIEIIPGVNYQTYEDGDTWRNVDDSSGDMLSSVSPEADQLIKQLNTTIKSIAPKLDATMTHFEGILKRTESAMTNVESMTVSAKNLIANPKIQQTMVSTLDDLQGLAKEARMTAKSMSVDLKATFKRNSEKLDLLTGGAVDLLQKFADTVDATRLAVTKLTEQATDPRVQQGLSETIDLAKTTLARFNQIASDLHSITGDTGIQTDIKSTVTSMKEATEDGQKLIKRVSSLVETFKPGGGPKLGIGRPALQIDLFSSSKTPHFRSDVNFRVPIGENNAFNVGLYDFAERYKLNAQYETGLKGFGNMRYGIYASKLGVGLNWGKFANTSFRVDAYNPNDFRVDAKALLRVNDDFSLWFGADNLFKRTTPIIGVRLSR